MAKKATFTCKICGGEHSGLICTAFGGRRGISVLESPAHKAAQRNLNQQMRAMLPAPPVIDAVAEPVTNKPAAVNKPARGRGHDRPEVPCRAGTAAASEGKSKADTTAASVSAAHSASHHTAFPRALK